MSLPTIIILDGPSGAGKSSISRALQEALLPKVWLGFAMDTILYTLPPSVLEGCNKSNDWSRVPPAVFTGGYGCLRALADAGNAIIFDTSVFNTEAAKELMEVVRGHRIATVAVLCDWEEIERRTILRGDRTIEEARQGFEMAPKHLRYDITINTTKLPPEEAAREIARQLGLLS